MTQAKDPIYVTPEQLPTDAQLEKIHAELADLCQIGNWRGIMLQGREQVPRKRRRVPTVRHNIW